MSDKRPLISRGGCPARKSVVPSDVGGSEDVTDVSTCPDDLEHLQPRNHQAQGSKLQDESL